MNEFDLIIIGAGPAGMKAALTAAQHNAKVLLLDEQPRAGGQIFRDVQTHNSRTPIFGSQYAVGKALVDALTTQAITTEFRATVWRIDQAHRVVWSRDGQSHMSCAPHVLLCGGAQERPMPFPGWTLPGVMSAGAAQILMKSSALLPKDAVLLGCGPLLYLIAAQLIEAGAAPKALVDTQSQAMFKNALRYLPQALPAAPTLMKGMGYLRKIHTSNVKRYVKATDLSVKATEAGALELSFKSQGHDHQLITPIVLTHQGVIPATHMSRAAGVAHAWNEQQQCVHPQVDEWGQSDVPGLHVAGDNVGIGGADAAQASGHLAALNILRLSSRINASERHTLSRKAWSKRRRALSIRPFLDAAYTPSADLPLPSNETIVCRCEEVTAGEIRRSVEQGANGPKHVKTAVRAGMGPCQGRLCEVTVRAILASCGAQTPIPKVRSPIKPVKLAELAALSTQPKTPL